MAITGVLRHAVLLGDWEMGREGWNLQQQRLDETWRGTVFQCHLGFPVPTSHEPTHPRPKQSKHDGIFPKQPHESTWSIGIQWAPHIHRKSSASWVILSWRTDGEQNLRGPKLRGGSEAFPPWCGRKPGDGMGIGGYIGCSGGEVLWAPWYD